ncbi:MAG: heme-binding protein [Acidobacteriia bacterium]|nr:heme-binding protein [Methyloceanibacter sp.]MBX5472315.1 heme-binding protein [Acetobacteraceae bacterium]MCL6492184.1 heme-binding protein [Terriglobia bacterium]
MSESGAPQQERRPASVALRSIDGLAAHEIVGAAVRHAVSLGIRINAAVVDPCGVLIAFLRMPGAPLHSIEIAIDKAYTAASFGLPTGAWSTVLEAHAPAVRQGLVLRPRFIAFGGGLPIVEGGERLGGVGVSGGSESEDEACARAGLAALGLAAE